MPNAAAGPFRDIRRTELGNGRVAPHALRDDKQFVRDVSVVDIDGDPATLEVVAYAARANADGKPEPTTPTNEIVRYSASDGRSFDRTATVVLTPSAAWEGGTVGAPSVIKRVTEWHLYYGAAGGIGLATSFDGASFARGAAPLLGAPTSGWDAGVVPASPAVIALPDGTLRMFYRSSFAGKPAIGEARSSDGVQWQRGAAPVLTVGDGYDSASVGAPSAVLSKSPLGRNILWLYYAAVDASGKRTILAAARDGLDGPFVRATSPVFGTGNSLAPGEPCVVRFSGFTLLYATQRAGVTSDQNYPAVVVGVAPANIALPAPAQ
jgi:hypothetical protein